MIASLLQVAAAAGGQPATNDQCGRARGDEIVVCGPRPGENPYRLPKLPDKYDPRQLRAETDVIPGVHTRAHVESAARQDGYVDNRLMVTFSVKF